MTDIEQYIIYNDQTILYALTKLNKLSGDSLVLYVLDIDKKLVGTLTDGDIRRNLILGKAMEDLVTNFMCSTPFFLVEKNFGLDEIDVIKEKKYRSVPILDKEGVIIQIINLEEKRSLLPLEAVIMAGGKGMRLRPLTEKLPKPLLKVGDKPIIEHNIDRLISFGINKINITVNYLGDLLESEIGSGEDKGIEIGYIDEGEEPLGTIGSVSLIERIDSTDVLIMNSDLLTNIDYEKMYKKYKSSDADMIVATIPYEVKIPYAVMITDEEKVLSFEEKPTYTYYSNAGIYIINKKHFSLIPKGENYNATDLMEDLIKQGKKVAYFPIVNYWLDIGKHEDYSKAQKDINSIKM